MFVASFVMADRSENHMSLRFLARADMWPSQINAAHPGAQFVARARVSAGQAPVAGYFAQSVTGDIWGLLISIASPGSEDRAVTVTTDDGRQFSASLADSDLLDGDPVAVLAAARYWELPPQFIAQLKQALQAGGVAVEDEEPRDDGSLV